MVAGIPVGLALVLGVSLAVYFNQRRKKFEKNMGILASDERRQLVD